MFIILRGGSKVEGAKTTMVYIKIKHLYCGVNYVKNYLLRKKLGSELSVR